MKSIKINLKIILLLLALFLLSWSRLETFIILGREKLFTYQINGFAIAFIGLVLAFIINILPYRLKPLKIIIYLLTCSGYIYTYTSLISLNNNNDLNYLTISYELGAKLYTLSFLIFLLSIPFKKKYN